MKRVSQLKAFCKNKRGHNSGAITSIPRQLRDVPPLINCLNLSKKKTFKDTGCGLAGAVFSFFLLRNNKNIESSVQFEIMMAVEVRKLCYRHQRPPALKQRVSTRYKRHAKTNLKIKVLFPQIRTKLLFLDTKNKSRN